MSGSRVQLGPPPEVTTHVLGVEVAAAGIPPLWEAPRSSGDAFRGDERRVFIDYGPVQLYVAGGDTLVVQAQDAATRSTYDYVAYAQAARLLLFQRHRFVLHSSLVSDPGGRLFAVMGEPMAGKSTATMELVERHGWSFVCDDIVEVDTSGQHPIAHPYERPVHLSDRAVSELGYDPAMGRALPGREKRVYSVLTPDLAPRPLAGILRLRVDDTTESVAAERLDPLGAIPVLGLHSDWAGICQLPGLRAEYFAWTTRLAATVPIVDVSRPAQVDSVSAVASTLARLAGALAA